MKRKLLNLLAIAMFAGLVFVSTNETKATVAAESDCPNGCLANGDGCWCRAWYPCYKEGPSAAYDFDAIQVQ
ncbi:MAG: hypothetical protein AB7S48_06720 [Bacteroidales bacterium]